MSEEFNPNVPNHMRHQQWLDELRAWLASKPAVQRHEFLEAHPLFKKMLQEPAPGSKDGLPHFKDGHPVD